MRRETEPDAPILAELFSVERLEQHAQTLAAAQAITDTRVTPALTRTRAPFWPLAMSSTWCPSDTRVDSSASAS